MTKKDYIKLAKLIKDMRDYHAIDKDYGFEYLPAKNFINELALVLKADNPRFDKERFIAACNS